MKTPKKKEKDSAHLKKPKVHPELDGFDIEINSFGEIKTKFDIGKINQFLDKHVDDKKFKDVEVQRADEKDKAKHKKKE